MVWTTASCTPVGAGLTNVYQHEATCGCADCQRGGCPGSCLRKLHVVNTRLGAAMAGTLTAWWAWCRVHVTACSTCMFTQTTKQQDPAGWGVEAVVCLWSIFKKCSLVIVYFIHMLTGILKREQARSLTNHLLQATLVPDLRGKGNPVGCSWGVILHGDNKERSRVASKDTATSYLVPRRNG